jgi:putative endonuclease
MNPVVRAFWNRWLGDRGEREAARFLRRKGLRILLRGYRTDQGEVDLVARDGAVVVFVEVKSRRQGTPAEAVTPEKQRRLTLAALHFLKKHGLLEHPSRFDVVAIVWPEGRRRPSSIEHLTHAFEAVGRGQLYR